MFIFSSLQVRKKCPKHTQKCHHQLQPLLLKHTEDEITLIMYRQWQQPEILYFHSSFHFFSLLPQASTFVTFIFGAHQLIVFKVLVEREACICKVL